MNRFVRIVLLVGVLAFVFVPRPIQRGSGAQGDRPVVVAAAPTVERALALVTERTADNGPVLLLVAVFFAVAAPLLRRRRTWASTAADVFWPPAGGDNPSPLRRGPPLPSV